MKRRIAALMALIVFLTGIAGLAEFSEDFRLAASSPYITAGQSGGLAMCAIRSSGDLKDKYGAYVASNAFDGSSATTWAEAASGDGEGEWLLGEWTVLSGSWMVEGIAIRAGYHKSSDVYYKNNRPREVEIEIDSGDDHRDYLVTLDDTMTCQYVLFDVPVPVANVADANGVGAKLTLWSVYSGSKYRDTCITEFDLLVAPLAAAPQADAGGWFGGDASGAATVQADGAWSPYASGMLYALYNNITEDEARARIARNDAHSLRCNDVYGSIDGVDVGYVGVLDLPESDRTAKAMLRNFLDFTWHDPGSSGIEALMTADAKVTLVKSELYAWNQQPVQPTYVDEYYLLTLEKGGVIYDIIYCAGYEMDGGDWSEGRVLGSR